MCVGSQGDPIVNLLRDWDIVHLVDVIGAFWPDLICFSST